MEVIGIVDIGEITVVGDLSVSSNKLAPNAVTTGKILDGTIVAGDLAALAVTDAKVATGIDAVKLADGSVTNAELQYINSLSSNAQTQLTAKAALATAQTFTAGQRGEITALTSGTTITIDMADSNNFSVTLAHNACLLYTSDAADE